MKKPTNRSFIFLVVRSNSLDATEEVPIASFLTQESAENYAGTCAQEFEDRGIAGFTFKTQCIIYYNE